MRAVLAILDETISEAFGDAKLGPKDMAGGGEEAWEWPLLDASRGKGIFWVSSHNIGGAYQEGTDTMFVGWDGPVRKFDRAYIPRTTPSP
jgi:hypothetical protein